ncbi:hypothetical protein QQ020_13970 [Fulvivirgaceae bacterium BMA12]|uniref:Uncharacterized protein n=1 Tax=Agaribacillus aureus TaxID=3051825 RepID=A0ABT8L8S4_9BACT|nr:hypothetical protein [Fulvivirgaceae bacterium BMA12]
MITRRMFMRSCSLSAVFLPVLACVTEDKETDVTWFLSETEITAIGKAYAQNSFSFIDKDMLVISGWVITLAEAEVCKKKYLESA